MYRYLDRDSICCTCHLTLTHVVKYVSVKTETPSCCTCHLTLTDVVKYVSVKTKTPSCCTCHLTLTHVVKYVSVKTDTPSCCTCHLTLTHIGKLAQRSQKIAFYMLHKLGGGKLVQPGNRVALVFRPDEAAQFMIAFYGCIFAAVIPVAIEPPISKDVRRSCSHHSVCYMALATFK